MSNTQAIATVRRFSAAGPCLTLGQLARQTAKFYFYHRWIGGSQFEASEHRVAKSPLVHIEPCNCCRDHEHTQYPHGYMD